MRSTLPGWSRKLRLLKYYYQCHCHYHCHCHYQPHSHYLNIIINYCHSYWGHLIYSVQPKFLCWNRNWMQSWVLWGWLLQCSCPYLWFSSMFHPCFHGYVPEFVPNSLVQCMHVTGFFSFWSDLNTRFWKARKGFIIIKQVQIQVS